MTPDQFHALPMTTGLSAQDYKERNETIIRMHVEEKKTLREIAVQFRLHQVRIRQIIAKDERLKAAEERRRCSGSRYHWSDAAFIALAKLIAS
jgi:DNA-directed RNA polymerase sigma subunit (sigma70/sigma32)